jgi:hypothetical protein
MALKVGWAIAACLVSVVTSCSEVGTPEQQAAVVRPQSEQTGNIGDTLTISTSIVNGYGKRLVGTADFIVANLQAIEAGNRQLPGTSAYSFDVMTVGKEGTVLVNPFFFAAQTDDGATLLTDTSLSDKGLSLKELTKGSKHSGQIFFDVPVGAKIKDVVFTEGLTGPTLGKWTAIEPIALPTTERAG